MRYPIDQKTTKVVATTEYRFQPTAGNDYNLSPIRTIAALLVQGKNEWLQKPWWNKVIDEMDLAMMRTVIDEME